MNLENVIKGVIEQKLTDGTVENLVAKNFEGGINEALRSLFRSYGDITKVIEIKLKEVMVPYIEGHDFSEYLVKLDSVLMELAKGALPENKLMLENFRTLMTPAPETIKVSELFSEWLEYAKENIETEGLDVDYDDEPTYEYTGVSLTFEQFEQSSWSISHRGELVFASDHDEEINISIPLRKWEDDSDKKWKIDVLKPLDIQSLRYADEFQVYLHSLLQAGTNIELDTDYESSEIKPNAKPECDW